MKTHNVYISPSLHTSDLLNLNNEIKDLIDAGIGWLHFDIMDGNFVNNFGLSTNLADQIKKTYPNLIIDAHTMANNIVNNLDQFKSFDYITFHYNSIQDIGFEKLILEIKNAGYKVGIGLDLDNEINDIIHLIDQIDLITIMSIKSGFAGQSFEESTWEKLKKILEIKKSKSKSFKIQIDGGVRWNNIYQLIDLGIDSIVVGSLMFGETNYKNVVNKIVNRGK